MTANTHTYTQMFDVYEVSGENGSAYVAIAFRSGVRSSHPSNWIRTLAFVNAFDENDAIRIAVEVDMLEQQSAVETK